MRESSVRRLTLLGVIMLLLAFSGAACTNTMASSKAAKPASDGMTKPMKKTMAENPCAAKTMMMMMKKMNPCAAKMLNPCAAKTLNPCAAKTLNPCAAKTLNPCAAKTLNPCAAKYLNPCLAKTLSPEKAKTLTPDEAKRSSL